jgi:hypothetical protein
MFFVPLRPIDAAALADLGRAPTPAGTLHNDAPKARRVWRRRPLMTNNTLSRSPSKVIASTALDPQGQAS